MSDREDRKKAERIARELSSYCNVLGFDPKMFVEEMASEHRSLQQTFTGLCVAWLAHCSELSEFQYDARNEYSVKLAKKMCREVDKYELQMPCI